MSPAFCKADVVKKTSQDRKVFRWAYSEHSRYDFEGQRFWSVGWSNQLAICNIRLLFGTDLQQRSSRGLNHQVERYACENKTSRRQSGGHTHQYRDDWRGIVKACNRCSFKASRILSDLIQKKCAHTTEIDLRRGTDKQEQRNRDIAGD